MNATNREEKVDEKNAVIYLASIFLSWVMILKLSKKNAFIAILCSLQQKIYWAIYIYASERSPYTLSENGIVYYAMT